MTIEHREGDLFAQDDIMALAHGVNCKGLMGAGIAVVFKRLYPEMFTQYQTRCAFDGLQLGQVMPWWSHDGHVVFNLATQYQPGKHADLNAVRDSLWSACALAYDAKIDTIGMPRIGAGIGGLNWDDVEAMINFEIVSDWPEVKIVVVTLPEPVKETS